MSRCRCILLSEFDLEALDLSTKYRAQILLEPEQHKTLQEIAEREGRSLSDVAREVIQRGLDAREQEMEAVWLKRAEALGRLDQIRKAIQEQHGIYAGDLLGEVRREREQQKNDALGWKSET